MGKRAGRPQVMGETVWVRPAHVGATERLGDAQMMPGRLPAWCARGHRFAHQVIGEADRQRVDGFEQTEGLQRVKTIEARLCVDAGRASEQPEVDVAADERGDLEQIDSVFVKAGSLFTHDVPDG